MERPSVIPSVADYMTPGPYYVGPFEPLPKAHDVMRGHGIRHLPVMADGRLVGILSDRDIHLAESLTHGMPGQLTVENAMTSDPYTVSPDAPLNHVARVMEQRRIGSAIVVDHGGIAGVFTVTDALQALVDTLEGTAPRRRFEAVTTAPPEPRRPNDLR